MSFWQDVLRFLDYKTEMPALYGWAHLLWVLCIIGSTVALCFWQKKSPKSRQVNVIFAISLAVFLLEIYKQINYSFSYENGISFNYSWYAFPFQFCSTPMYVGLLASVIRKGRVHDALCSYLATFAFFAGLCVMFYPGDVFSHTLGITLQTMVCHGTMIVLAIYLLYSGYVELSYKTVLKGAAVFASCMAIATVMNEIAYISRLLEEHTFNMFFISPHCEPSLPVYSIVQHNVAYPWCLIFYIGAFTLASYVIILACKHIKFIATKKKIKA